MNSESSQAKEQVKHTETLKLDEKIFDLPALDNTSCKCELKKEQSLFLALEEDSDEDPFLEFFEQYDIVQEIRDDSSYDSQVESEDSDVQYDGGNRISIRN